MTGSLLPLAKRLRSEMTDAERILWRHLRAHRICGFKFRRQQTLGRYIVDFVCFEAKLILEIDGGQHAESATDSVRDAWLRENGYRVLRFWNNEVLLESESVLESILDALKSQR